MKMNGFKGLHSFLPGKLLQEANEGSKKVLYTCLFLILVTWLPTVLLSLIEGVFFSKADKIGLSQTPVFHIQFLVIVPLLLVSEYYAIKIILIKLRSFSITTLLDDNEKIAIIKTKAIRLANSYWLHLVLCVLIIVFNLAESQEYSSYCHAWVFKECGENGVKWTYAGFWRHWISNSIFLFIFIRNFWLIIVWSYIVFKISRLPLRLAAIHPDKFGGLGFLSELPFPFMITTFSFTTIVISAISRKMVVDHKGIESFYPVLFVLALFIIIIHLAPLLSLVIPLAKCKLIQRREYASLILKHHHQFYNKWIDVKDGKLPEEILGNPDPSSAADSNTYYETLLKMKVIPINIKALVAVAAISLSPIIGLFLIEYNLEEVFKYLFELLFNTKMV